MENNLLIVLLYSSNNGGIGDKMLVGLLVGAVIMLFGYVKINLQIRNRQLGQIQ